MKFCRMLPYIGVFALTVALFTGGVYPAGSETGPGRDNPASVPAVLGVNEFMKNVDRYPGKRQVEGLVSAVSPENQTFYLIDLKEFQECGVTTCAPLTLPLKWQGPLPAVREVIRIRGVVRKSNGKFFFEVHGLEKKGTKLLWP